MSPALKRLLLAALPVALLLVGVAPASAAVTASSVTSPSGTIPYLMDTAIGSPTVSVSGTATANDGDQVDLRCFSGPSSSSLYKAGVTVTGGAFSTTINFSTHSDQVCALRAVPAGTNTTTASFTGPTLMVSFFDTATQKSGNDYYFGAQQRQGVFGYDSIGWCGITWSAVIDPSNLNRYSNSFYWCNQWLYQRGLDPAKSEVTLDGQNAYTPGALPTAYTGFVRPTITYTFDPTNGNTTIVERDPLFLCPTETRGANGINGCPGGLVDTGVRVDRTIVSDHEGQQSRITDTWLNTTGAPHALALSYEQDFNSASTYQFPNGETVSSPVSGQSIAGPFASPSTTYISATGASDPSPDQARGAITTYPGADSATLADDTEFFLNYSRTLAAGGTFKVDAVFNQAFASSDVNLLSAGARALVTPPPPVVPKPTFSKSGSAKATYNKKTKKITLATGQSVLCPAGGAACVVSGKLTSKVMIAKKKGKKKAKYKTYTIGKLSGTIAPGTTKKLSLVLSKSSAKLLLKYKKLKISVPMSVVLGTAPAVTQKATFTVKAPKIPKKKKKK